MGIATGRLVGRGRRFLILHGVENWRPRNHWQWWLAEQLRSRGEQVLYPQLPRPEAPNLMDWQQVLFNDLEQLGDGERVVIAHSCSVSLWLLSAPQIARHHAISRVLLVAPPGPSVFTAAYRGFLPVGFDPGAIAAAAKISLVVASDNDPYCPEGVDGLRAIYVTPTGLPLHLIPGVGHISLDEGFGPWPEVLAWCTDPPAGGSEFPACS